MKTYIVDCVYTVHDYRTVKAGNEKEAIENAKNMDCLTVRPRRFEDFISAKVVEVKE